MKPYIHAQKTVKKHGGTPEDYLDIHNFFDTTKAAFPDMRHRAILHNSYGIFLIERIFGTFLVNSDGRKVQTRDIAEQHVIDDLGFIPTLGNYLRGMPFYPWLGGKVKKKEINLVD